MLTCLGLEPEKWDAGGVTRFPFCLLYPKLVAEDTSNTEMATETQ